MIGQSIRNQLREVRLSFKILSSNFEFFIDKERYEKELKSLESFSDNLKKPKKCLSAYMIFVKEVWLCGL